MARFFDRKETALQAAQRDLLADEISELTREVRGLRQERDNTAELNTLRQQVETLKLEKDRLVESNDRKIRETEHAVGLLKQKNEQDTANAIREAELKVREDNLSIEQERFKADMDFRTKHMAEEMDRFEGVLQQVLERLPILQANMKITKTDA